MKCQNNIIILALLVLTSCATKNTGLEIENKTQQVKIFVVEKQIYNYSLHTSGRIAAEEEQKLSFKTGGLIGKILVKEGQKVKKGALLATLDLVEINAKVDQAKLAFEKAQRDLKRARNLYNDSVATLQQFQDAKTALDYAKSNLDIAVFNLNYSKITAPESGIVLKKMAEENEMTGSGYPVILFGSNRKNWIVKAIVTDNQVVNIHIDDKAIIQTDAYPGTDLHARVIEISNFADPYTGVFDIKLMLEPVNLKLVSGLIASVDITSGKSEEMLKVPYDALINANGNNATVFKVEKHKVTSCEIDIFKLLDNYVLVNKGINKGDTLITENVSNVRVNDSVEIVK